MAESIRGQIRILKRKGMVISSPSEARKILGNENYYNVINAYKDLFIDPTYSATSSTDPKEKFLPNTNFDELYNMFLFDKELRELFLKYFLIIENQFKTHVAYEFALLYGEEGYLNVDNFNFSKSNALNVVELQSIINSTIYKNRTTDRIKHFYEINRKSIPIWALVSFFEIGKIRKFYINCKDGLKKTIASKYNLNVSQLTSMIAIINMFRNVCAHDNRLYCYKLNDDNKQIADTEIHSNMKIDTISTPTGDYYTLGKRDLFAIVISLRYLLSNELFNEFYNELIKIVNVLKSKLNTISIDKVLKKMGFPLSSSSGQLDWTSINTVAK